MLFKKVLWKDQREFLFAKIWGKSIVNENALNSEDSLMHYQGRLTCSNYFSNCNVDMKKTVLFLKCSTIYNYMYTGRIY